ncbi:MAG: hypothetical protein E2O96_04395, partial [Acidobacteria bacterium]
MSTDRCTPVETSVDNSATGGKGLLTQAQRTSDSWTEFRETLRAGVSKGNWETWLSRLEADHAGDTLVLIAPTEFHLRWV